jgi:hypothetical protein
MKLARKILLVTLAVCATLMPATASADTPAALHTAAAAAPPGDWRLWGKRCGAWTAISSVARARTCMEARERRSSWRTRGPEKQVRIGVEVENRGTKNWCCDASAKISSNGKLTGLQKNPDGSGIWDGLVYCPSLTVPPGRTGGCYSNFVTDNGHPKRAYGEVWAIGTSDWRSLPPTPQKP